MAFKSDDDNRIVLESIGCDCIPTHEFINAGFIDVSRIFRYQNTIYGVRLFPAMSFSVQYDVTIVHNYYLKMVTFVLPIYSDIMSQKNS